MKAALSRIDRKASGHPSIPEAFPFLSFATGVLKARVKARNYRTSRRD
nr:MAG TPA: hypothetical protein [Caudoviricetes sp.]